MLLRATLALYSDSYPGVSRVLVVAVWTLLATATTLIGATTAKIARRT